MNVKGKYKQFGHLRQFVIETAINDINENTRTIVLASSIKRNREVRDLRLKAEFP